MQVYTTKLNVPLLSSRQTHGKYSLLKFIRKYCCISHSLSLSLSFSFYFYNNYKYVYYYTHRIYFFPFSFFSMPFYSCKIYFSFSVCFHLFISCNVFLFNKNENKQKKIFYFVSNFFVFSSVVVLERGISSYICTYVQQFLVFMRISIFFSQGFYWAQFICPVILYSDKYLQRVCAKNKKKKKFKK